MRKSILGLLGFAMFAQSFSIPTFRINTGDRKQYGMYLQSHGLQKWSKKQSKK